MLTNMNVMTACNFLFFALVDCSILKVFLRHRNRGLGWIDYVGLTKCTFDKVLHGIHLKIDFDIPFFYNFFSSFIGHKCNIFYYFTQMDIFLVVVSLFLATSQEYYELGSYDSFFFSFFLYYQDISSKVAKLEMKLIIN